MSSTMRKAPILGKLRVAALFFAASTGCDGGNSSGSGNGDMEVRLDLLGSSCTSADTFKAAQTAMLSSCGGGGPRQCHGTSPYSGNLDLTTANAYHSLVGVAASIAPSKLRVKPQDPDGSFLVQKLTDKLQASEGQPMPLGEGILWHAPDPTALAVLRCWITLGAPNN